MSPGKLAAQVSHASMAFLTTAIRQKSQSYETVKKYLARSLTPYSHADRDGVILYKRHDLYEFARAAASEGKDYFYARPVEPGNPYGKLVRVPDEEVSHFYEATLTFDKDTYEGWIDGAFTKVVCEAKNKEKLLKATEIARDLGLEEWKDYFLIKDNCYTELTPEEVDENGVGRTLTCVGFRPLEDSVAHEISKKFQLYR